MPHSTDYDPGGRFTPVRCVLEVDLRRHVGRDGLMDDDARLSVHRSFAEVPPGMLVRCNIGKALWLPDGVLTALADEAFDASGIEITGADIRGIRSVTEALHRRLNEARVTAA